MAVRIHDTETEKTYIAKKPEDCRGADRHVFEMVERLGETITMGKVIGEPVKMDTFIGALDLAWGNNRELWEDFLQEAEEKDLPLRVSETGLVIYVYTTEEFREEAGRLFQLMC